MAAQIEASFVTCHQWYIALKINISNVFFHGVENHYINPWILSVSKCLGFSFDGALREV